MVVSVPRTKVSDTGKRLSWNRQSAPLDPEDAWLNHLRVNYTGNPEHEHAFSYEGRGKKRVPLTRTTFLRTVGKAAKSAGHCLPQGHGIRIGSTLEYLLRGIPFDVVKVKGRWKSEAFLIYLRRHADILAPHMQAQPALQGEFIRYAMPPVR